MLLESDEFLQTHSMHTCTCIHKVSESRANPAGDGTGSPQESYLATHA